MRERERKMYTFGWEKRKFYICDLFQRRTGEFALVRKIPQVPIISMKLIRRDENILTPFIHRN